MESSYVSRSVAWRYLSQMPGARCALALLLLALLALAGCGGSSSTVTVSPTSLVIVRTIPSGIRGGDAQPLNITITDDTAVRAFYQRTLALPPIPQTNGAPTGCTDMHGIRYFLIFSQAETVVLFGRLTQGNCGGLQLLGAESQDTRHYRQADTAYLDALAGLLGISPMQVWPEGGGSPTPTVTAPH